MACHVAVIDLGKTNSKVALVDTATATEVQLLTQAAVVNSETLYPSLDHAAIETFIIDALCVLAAHQTIDAITITTHGATAALINTAGRLVLPVIDYEFSGIDETRDAYNLLRPAFADTGSPALPGGLNIGAQLYWQQSRHPKQFADASTLLTWPQYWVHLLCGERHNDVTSLGCHSDLYEPRHQRYSSLVDSINLRSLMPATRHSGQLSGTLRASIAKSTGLRATTPVYTGIHDSNASLVPHLIARDTAYSVVSTGTWFIAMAIGGAPTSLDENKDTLLNVNARGRSVPSARFMGGRERELLGVSDVATDQAMNRLLDDKQLPTMLMPSMVTGTGPYPNSENQWVGTEAQDDKPRLHCAVTLYLAMMTHECMLLIGSRGPTYIEGPLAHDKYYARMLAAVSQRPVFTSTSRTGTSVGAAMLISPPKQLPRYDLIELDETERHNLERYARSWREQLRVHTR
ncbi:MAG: FGGY-family carbohydrate kinase [Granulosicoccus sp.]